MHLFQKVSTPYLSEIQSSVLDLIDKHGAREVICRFNDPTWYLENVSKLREFLDGLGLAQDLDTCYLTTIDPHGRMTVHVDISNDNKNDVNWCMGLNIPIQNTQQSRVIWYDRVKFDRWAVSPIYSESVPCFEPLDQVGELVMSDPHWIRVNVPHTVENYGSHRRILLSLRFRPEPRHLWLEPLEPLDIPTMVFQPGRIYDFK